MTESSPESAALPSSRPSNRWLRWIGGLSFMAMIVMVMTFFIGHGPWLLTVILLLIPVALVSCVCGVVLLFQRDWAAGLVLSLPAGLLLLAAVLLFSGGIPWLGYSGYG